MFKKLAVTLVVLFALAGAGVFVAVKFLPQTELERIVKEKVREATGREIDFKNARVVVFPDIAIALDDVSFGNASWAKDKNMVELKQLNLSLALAPLFHKSIEVKKLVLDTPVIHLEKNTDGKGNWDFASAQKKPDAAPAETSSGQPFAFRAGEVKITKGALTFADRKAGTLQSLDGIDVSLDASDLSSPLKLKGEVNYKQKRVALVANLEKPQAFLDGKPSPGSISLDAEGMAVKAAGDIATQGTMLNGNIEANVTQLGAVSAWLGSGAKPPFEKLSFKSAATATADKVKLNGIALSLDYIEAKGDVTADLSGRTVIAGRLSVGKLDLDKLAPPKAENANAEASSAPQADWDATPIDFSGLKSADADLTLVTGGFSLRGADVGPSTLTVTLKNGELHASSSEATLFGGKFSSTVGANASGAVSFKFDMAGVEAKPVLTTFAHFKKLSGTADAHVSVTSAGQSQKAIVGNLAGSGSVTFKDGEMQGIDLARIAKLLQSRFTEMNAGEGSTKFVTLGGTFTVAKGVATNSDLKMQGPLVTATGQGQVDLPQKYVAYRVLPVLTLASGADAQGISVPVDIKGPFSNVKIRPDYGSVIQNAIKNPEQLKNAVKDFKPMLKDIRKNPLGALGGILGVPVPQEQAPVQAAPEAQPAPAQPEAPPAAPAQEPAPQQPAPAP